jgi:hypothetical protein
LTLPNIPDKTNGLAFYQKIIASWQAEVIKIELLDPTVVASIALQSFPDLIGKGTEARGGNAMGLTGSDGGRFITELSFLYTLNTTTQGIYATSRAMTAAFHADYQAILPKAAGAETYLPLFMNDAAYDQDVTHSYGGYTGFAASQNAVDPKGFFSKRTGGFKY